MEVNDLGEPSTGLRKSSRLASRVAQARADDDLTAPPPKLKKKAKTPSERNKSYRAGILSDPVKAAEYRERNRLRSQEYRASLTAEQHKKANEGARMRNANYRQRKKEEKASKPCISTRQSQKADAERRQRQTKYKQKYRENLSHQKKTAINAKRRLKRQAEKEANQQSSQSAGIQRPIPPPSTPSPMSRDKRTTEAKRKALQRARKSLPTIPEHYAATLEDLHSHASPRKKAALERRGMSTDHSKVGHFLVQAASSLSSKKNMASRTARQFVLEVYEKYGSFSKRSRVLHMNRKTVARHSKPKQPSKREEKTKQSKAEIEAFFVDSAAHLPDKKLVSKKTGEAKAQLRKPIAMCHKEYRDKGGKSSFSQFAKCRPKNIRKMGHANLNQCLCEYCENVSLKIKAINNIHGEHPYIKHVYHAVALTTCANGGKACAYRQCGNCDINKLEEHLAPLKNHRGQVSWHRWTSKKVSVGGQEVNRKVLETRRGGATDLLQELCQEVAFLSEHLFRADWQNRQFQDMKCMRPFPSSRLVVVMDFAENYTCTYQQEVQSAHWHHNSVTIHPISTYRACPHCDEGMVNESLIFISNDMRHDHHAVHVFIQKTLQHISTGQTFDHVIQWSDGCGAQYKSKGPFADVARSEKEFGVPIDRNFFGSRHGKSPCDGEAAVVKSFVYRAVVASDGTLIISNAREFFEFCNDSSLRIEPGPTCCHFQRSFFWVPTEDITRDRPHTMMKTVKGTRSFHHIRSTPAGGNLLARHLSCMCPGCLTGVDGDCQHQDVVGAWKEYTLVPDNTAAHAPRQADACTPDATTAPPDVRSCQAALPDTTADAPPATLPDATANPVTLPDATADAPSATLPDATANPVTLPDATADAPPATLPDATTDAPLVHTERCQDAANAPILSASPVNADPGADQRDRHSRTLKVGDFVRANVLPASRRVVLAKSFHGMIDTLDGDGAVVRLLRKRGSSFVWPAVEERIFVKFEEVVEVLPVPTLDRRGRHTF